MGYKKTTTIYAKFLPVLEGKGTKTSSSADKPLITMSDKPNEVKNKINKYAFSGGQDTAEKQRDLGAKIEVDVSYCYLGFFSNIKEKYSTGKMLTGEIKGEVITVVNDFLKEYQENRSKVTDQDVKLFMTPRKMDPIPDIIKK